MGGGVDSILKTLYFNFHYLPFKQAVKLPILLRKPELIQCKGKIVLDVPKVKPAMIRLGFRSVSIYPDNGIAWDNHGATVIFRGHASIGNDSSLSFGRHATVSFGDNFQATTSLKLVSYRSLTIGQNVSMGWQTLIMDTNFHPLYDLTTKTFLPASSPITIGDYNWFGTQCKIMHGVNTPHHCIFGMGSTLTRHAPMQSYCLMGGNPLKILTENVTRILGHDEPE